MDQGTIASYNANAEAWISATKARNLDDLQWVDTTRAAGPVADLGCGPGWHSAIVGRPSIALDASSAMINRAAPAAPDAAPVQASVVALPFSSDSIGGVFSDRVYVHLPQAQVPAALAELHRTLMIDAPVFLHLFHSETEVDTRNSVRLPGRLFSYWPVELIADVAVGAGFSMDDLSVINRPDSVDSIKLRLRKIHTLADTVGPKMRLLTCGLNPSIYSADAGVGYARPGNRFWPAILGAGLATEDRDAVHALRHHGLGMTDLAKRPTVKAAEVSRAEFADGIQRLERIVRWLKPRAVCFVGLAGWREAVSKTAQAGPQPQTLGGRPVYLIPSTSGLNAHSQLPDLIEHFTRASALADRS